jgi:hypothetical protein
MDQREKDIRNYMEEYSGSDYRYLLGLLDKERIHSKRYKEDADRSLNLMAITLEMVKAENERLKRELMDFVNTVDDSLLLDEKLEEAWGELHLGVKKAREALKK